MGCAAVRGAQVGFDLEQGTDERLSDWVAREATVKAAGVGDACGAGGDTRPRGVPCAADGAGTGRALDAFPGASACVMTSIEVPRGADACAGAGGPVFMSNEEHGALRNTIYKHQARAPGRRMSPALCLLYRLAVPVMLGGVCLWWRMARVVRALGAQHLEAALARAPSAGAVLTGTSTSCIAASSCSEQRGRGLTVGWLISPSVDGELGAMLVRPARRGGDPGGSSTHTGARALRDYYTAADQGAGLPGA